MAPLGQKKAACNLHSQAPPCAIALLMVQAAAEQLKLIV